MSSVPPQRSVLPRRPGTVVVSIDGTDLQGCALDLRRWDVAPDTVAEAVRTASTPGPRRSRSRQRVVRVACATAAPVHAHVCRIPPPRSFDLYDALVAAARSTGVVPRSVHRLERARLELQLVSRDLDSVDRTAAKRRVAETSGRTRRLDERVATLRGRLEALREVGADTSAVEADLADATTALTEAETERIAAEQRLSQVERAARDARDRRQRRLHLSDRVANLRREARSELVAAVYDEFRAAVDALPGDADAGSEPSSYTGDPTTASLAVARVAHLASPVVLSAARFGSPAEAATRLDAPVLRV